MDAGAIKDPKALSIDPCIMLSKARGRDKHFALLLNPSARNMNHLSKALNDGVEYCYFVPTKVLCIKQLTWEFNTERLSGLRGPARTPKGVKSC